MKLGALVHQAHGYKVRLRLFYFLPKDLLMVLPWPEFATGSSFDPDPRIHERDSTVVADFADVDATCTPRTAFIMFIGSQEKIRSFSPKE